MSISSKLKLLTGEGCFHNSVLYKIGTGGNIIKLSTVINENNPYQKFLAQDGHFIVARLKDSTSPDLVDSGVTKKQRIQLIPGGCIPDVDPLDLLQADGACERLPIMHLFSCAATADGFPFDGTTNIYLSAKIIAMVITTAKSISHNRKYIAPKQKGPVFSLSRSKHKFKNSLKNDELFSLLKEKEEFNLLEPIDPIFFTSEEWHNIKNKIMLGATIQQKIPEERGPYFEPYEYDFSDRSPEIIIQKKSVSFIIPKKVIDVCSIAILKRKIKKMENKLKEMKETLLFQENTLNLGTIHSFVAPESTSEEILFLDDSIRVELAKDST